MLKNIYLDPIHDIGVGKTVERTDGQVSMPKEKKGDDKENWPW